MDGLTGRQMDGRMDGRMSRGHHDECDRAGWSSASGESDGRHCRYACRDDKLLHTLALLKLGLLPRKVLLFVNSIDAGFRLRLFLESFGIRTAVLNAELPLNSRHHILQVKGQCFSIGLSIPPAFHLSTFLRTCLGIGRPLAPGHGLLLGFVVSCCQDRLV
jgi:Helicase conserved C-terminal domain